MFVEAKKCFFGVFNRFCDIPKLADNVYIRRDFLIVENNSCVFILDSLCICFLLLCFRSQKYQFKDNDQNKLV